MIKQHFHNELVKCGYPDNLTIEYSLGYSQGDGVAFYGNLSVDNIKALINRLFSTDPSQVDAVSRVKNLMAQKDIEEIISVIQDFGSYGLSITRNSHGYHYSHWNCMRIEDNVVNTGLLQDSLLEIWDRFVLELEDDVKSMSKKLESDGYSLRRFSR